MENQEITTLFDAYLDKTLNKDEVLAFEEKLNDDANFKIEFEAHQYLIDFVERKTLIDKLKQFESTFLPDKTTLIDDYLNNSLSEELEEYVQNKIEEDKDFKLEIDAQKLLIEQVKRNLLKDRLNSFEQKANTADIEETKKVVFKVEHPQEDQKRKIEFTRIVGIAASVLIVAFTGLFYLNSDSTPQNSMKMISEYSIQVEEKNEGLGFAKEEQQNIQVKLFMNKKLKNHYKFNNGVLSLYFENDVKEHNVNLLFDATATPSFQLKLDNKNYFIEFTETPLLLK
ncbi:hypothetical protein [Flammeovirga pacifica]|uniref:Uncharacterized protein n=1 Tax=Flammeovirga pacifica TaxID=915059 RepID=A0A1S1Z418_FLAPC|nr:hypothetical protein [Flammeovirga pacifica]OHX68034.1 hypothetical protein NH26_17640 [Flammeovirga pacifica]